MDGVKVDVEALQEVSSQISEIDVVLDANSGSKSAGKRAVKNQLIASGDSEFATQVVSQLRDNFEGESLFGTYLTILDALENEFEDETDEVVSQKVEEQASNVEAVSDEEVVKMTEKRKGLVEQFKALKNILEMFGQDVSNIPNPKIRRGGAGPRGPRTLSKFQYTVNETELEPEVNSLSTVAKLCGNIKVKDLKAHIEAQGIDLKEPPVSWSAELPNEVGTLTATVLPEFEDEWNGENAESDSADDSE